MSSRAQIAEVVAAAVALTVETDPAASTAAQDDLHKTLGEAAAAVASTGLPRAPANVVAAVAKHASVAPTPATVRTVGLVLRLAGRSAWLQALDRERSVFPARAAPGAWC